MPEFFIYLIKANIALTIFYLAYRLVLRKLTFYTLNRLFLLFGIVFSAVFPLVDPDRLFTDHEKLVAGVTHYSPDWYALQQYLKPETFTIWTLIRYLFWAGVIVMAVRLLIQLLSLLRIHLRTTDGRLKQENVRLMHDTINPFSFFKNIYVNPRLHNPEELQDIIIHEKMHVKGWHTADILLAEINNIFYWFNPGAWMLKTAVRENLEFITDRKILQSGVDAKAYQYNLIRVSKIPFAVPLANNFNFSHIRQRIRMMNKKRSSGYHLLRYLFLVPLISLVVLVVTSSGAKNRNDNSVLSKIIQVGTISDKITFRPSDTAVPAISLIGDASVYQDADTSGQGYSYARKAYQAAKEKDYDKATALAKKALHTDPGNDKARQILVYVDQMKTYEKKMADYHQKKRYRYAGNNKYADQAYEAAREKDLDKAAALANKALQADPGDQEAKQVLVYISRMKSYQQKILAYHFRKRDIKDTVSPVQTKRQAVKPTVIFTPPKVVKDSEFYAKPKVHFTPPKIVKDSVDQVKEKIKVHYTPPKVIKDSVYQVKPKVHYTPPKVIKSTAIGQSSHHKSAQTLISTSPNAVSGVVRPGQSNFPLQITSKPLFIIDGVQKDSTDLKKLSPNSIWSITVLKGTSATSLYGNKARDGAILITTRGYERKNGKNRRLPPEDTVSGTPQNTR